jgi:hypothetical protein
MLSGISIFVQIGKSSRSVIKSMYVAMIKPLKPQRKEFYLKTEFVPRSEHVYSRSRITNKCVEILVGFIDAF